MAAFVWSRFLQFLPEIGALFALFIALQIYLLLLDPVLADRLADDPKWGINHPWKALLLVRFPLFCLWGPVREEIQWRAAVVILFATLSPLGIAGIAISALGFALIHLRNFRRVELLPLAAGDGDQSTRYEYVDNTSGERISEQRIVRVKCMKVFFTFILGLCCGYVGIRYQSLYACVLLHGLWNFLLIVIIEVLIRIVRGRNARLMR